MRAKNKPRTSPELEKVAFGYCRVSTGRQAAHGVSLDAQREQIEAWCTFKGYRLGEVLVDAGISGSKTKNRPAMQRAIELACEAQSPLVVYSLSRFARSTLDAIVNALKLEKAGADLVSIKENYDTTSPAGRLLFRMMASFAEFERDVISERTCTALDYKRSKGQRISGKIPFGFDLAPDGKTLVVNEVESRGRDRIRQLRESKVSLRGIAEQLNAEGIRSKGGKPWEASSVQRILESIARNK